MIFRWSCRRVWMRWRREGWMRWECIVWQVCWETYKNWGHHSIQVRVHCDAISPQDSPPQITQLHKMHFCKSASFPFLLDYLKAQILAFETDIHAVAGLLKRYFRELPDPLFTDELYVSFVQALGKNDNFPPNIWLVLGYPLYRGILYIEVSLYKGVFIQRCLYTEVVPYTEVSFIQRCDLGENGALKSSTLGQMVLHWLANSILSHGSHLFFDCSSGHFL